MVSLFYRQIKHLQDATLRYLLIAVGKGEPSYYRGI